MALRGFEKESRTVMTCCAALRGEIVGQRGIIGITLVGFASEIRNYAFYYRPLFRPSLSLSLSLLIGRNSEGDFCINFATVKKIIEINEYGCSTEQTTR